MAMNSAFADGFGGAPRVGLLGSWPPDPAQSLPQGLLPNAPTPQPTVGVLGLPGDPASAIDRPFDPYQLAGAGPQPGGDLALWAVQMRALQAIRDHLNVAAGWLPQPTGQGGPAPDTGGSPSLAVQPPPPPITASTAQPVTAMAPPTGALQPFDPSGGFTPDRTFTVGAGDADGTLTGIARQLYPDNPVAGVGLLARANRLRANAQNSPILIQGQALTAPAMSGDAASLSAFEHDGRSILSANHQGLQALAARRAEEARQQWRQPDLFTQRLMSGQNVRTGQPFAPSQGEFTRSQVPGSFDRLGAILAAPPLPPRPPIESLGGKQYADIPDAAGDHLYPVEGYRSDGMPVLSGGAFLVPPDPVGEARAQRSAAWLQATDKMADSPGGSAGLFLAGLLGGDERAQLNSIDLGDALGGLVLAGGAVGGDSPGFLNAASPKLTATRSAEIGELSAGLEPESFGHGPVSDKDQSDASSLQTTENAVGNIQEINGRTPINSKYARNIYPFDKLTPSLKAKYPEIHLKYPDSVRFTPQGHPDFLPYAIAKITRADLTGNYTVDRKIANKHAGINGAPSDFLWHHVEDGKTMLLIPADLHDAVRHTGGVAVIKQRGKGQ